MRRTLFLTTCERPFCRAEFEYTRRPPRFCRDCRRAILDDYNSPPTWYRAHCVVCAGLLLDRRDGAVTCGARCRQQLYNIKKAAKDAARRSA